MVAKRAKGVTAKVPFPQRINRHTSQRPVTRSRTASCMVPILQRDTLEEVLKFLTPRELTGCASVCSAWRDVALSAALWKTRCEVGTWKK
jgi:F-box-like